MELSGIIGVAAAIAAAGLVEVTIVISLELVLAIVAGNLTAAIELWIVFTFLATDPLEEGAGRGIIDADFAWGAPIVVKNGEVKGAA